LDLDFSIGGKESEEVWRLPKMDKLDLGVPKDEEPKTEHWKLMQF